MKFLHLLCIIWSVQLYSQDVRTIRFTSSHTSFPDTAREKGHLYNKILYEKDGHYNDNSVLIFVPPGFHPDGKVNMVFWFHGWQNNIDSAAVNYDLVNQFVKSKINAVLVLAETAKNSPDSYGGKLEGINEFKGLAEDIMLRLKKEKIIKNQKPGNITLAGHSGAYRVMAYILQNGKVPVNQVILFDALYSETDKFINWIKEDAAHRFINIYTNGGGTDVESKQMVTLMEKENIPSNSIEESALTDELVKKHRIIIIHSLHKHNDVIRNPDNFKLFLESFKK